MARPETAAVRLLAGIREPVRLVALSNINIATGGLVAVDGITPVAGDRILLPVQTDATENGIYTAAAGQWRRASDARSSRSIAEGVQVRVQDGNTKPETTWVFTTANPDIGDDDIVVEQVPEAVSIFQFGGIGDDVADDTPALNLAIGAAGGRAIYLPGDDKIYRFTASAITDKTVKVYGEASYRISEDGAFTNPHPFLDDDGIGDDSYTVAGSLNYLYKAAETPQFLYALPNDAGVRGKNLSYGSAAPALDPRYSSWAYIAGNEKTAQSLLYASRVTIVGDDNIPNIPQLSFASIVGSNILSLARGEIHRANIFGNGAMGQALAVKTRSEGYAIDNIPYNHEYQSKSWWIANADVATKQWLYDAGIANSGLRRFIEGAASAWITAHSYAKGNWVAQGGRNYWCLISHTSGTLATDLATGKWYDAGPVVATVYSGDENDVANITTLGDVGAAIRFTTSDDGRFFSSWGRDDKNHAFKVYNSNTGGYKCLATPTLIDTVDGLGNYAFQRGFGSILDFAFLGGHTGEHTQTARYGFSGGPYNFQWATTVSGMAATGYQIARYAGCGPAVGVSDSSWTDWATSTSYTGGVAGAGSYVIVSGVVYRCVTSHTSGVWATDLAAAKWMAVSDYEPTAIYLQSDHDHATRGKVQLSVVSGYLAALNTGRIIRSFLGCQQVMEQAYGAVDDIVIGTYGLRYSRSTTGKRIIFGGNSYPYLKYGNLFSIFSDTLSRGVISFDLANGGGIVNANPSANMATATGPDRITEAWHIWNKAGDTQLGYFINAGGLFLTGASSAFVAQRLESTNANATGGPFIDLVRSSSNPLAANNMGGIRFFGKNLSATEIEYLRVRSTLDDPTAGSEDGHYEFQTIVAGTLASRWHLGGGFFSSGLTDPGVGKINVTTAYQVNGVQVVGAQSASWIAQTATPSKADLGASPTVGALAQWAAAVDAMLKAHGLTRVGA